MAKKKTEKDFLESFDSLSAQDQDKLIKKLQKNQKQEKPPGAPKIPLTGAGSEWN